MKIRQILLALVVGACAAPLLIAADAEAQQRRARPANIQRADVNVTFQDLQIFESRGGVSVTYALNPQSWNQLRQLGISAQLNLYVPGARNRGYEFLYSVPLDRQSGQIDYPDWLDLDNAPTIEFEVVGFAGPYFVSRSTLGRASEPRLRLAVDRRGGRPNGPNVGPPTRPGPGPGPVTGPPERPHGPHTGPHGHPHDHPQGPRDRGPQGSPWRELNENERRAQIISACNNTSRFDSERTVCRNAANNLRGQMIAETITACGQHSRSAATWGACIELANAHLFPSRVETINACNQGARFESDFQACVTRARPLAQPAAATIAECKASSPHSSDQHKCLELAAPLGVGAEQVVAACRQSSRFSSDMQRCMQDANSGPRRR